MQEAVQAQSDRDLAALEAEAVGGFFMDDTDPEAENKATQDDIIADALTRNTIYTAKYKLTGHSLHVKFRNIAQHYWICDPTVQEMKDQSLLRLL
jgi:hypothetical protein